MSLDHRSIDLIRQSTSEAVRPPFSGTPGPAADPYQQQLPHHVARHPNRHPIVLSGIDAWPLGRPEWHAGLGLFLCPASPMLRFEDLQGWPSTTEEQRQAFRNHWYSLLLPRADIWDRHMPSVIYLGYLYTILPVRHHDQQGTYPIGGQWAMQHRAAYLHVLHETLKEARRHAAEDPHWLASLEIEWTMVMKYHEDWIRKRIYPHLRGSPPPDVCWPWYGPMANGRPALTVRGANDVPVHRLLWHVLRPQVYLGPERRPQRLQHCTGVYCVNPWHFGLFDTRLREVEDDRTRPGLPGQYRTYRFTWRVPNDEKEVGHRWVVCCPRCGNTLNESVQAQYANGAVKGLAHCSFCYQAAKGRRPVIAKHYPSLREQVDNPTGFEAETQRRMNLRKWAPGPRGNNRLPLPPPQPALPPIQPQWIIEGYPSEEAWAKAQII